MGKLIFLSILAIFGFFTITESSPNHLRGTFPLAKKREVTNDDTNTAAAAPTIDPLLAGIEDPLDRLNFLAYAEKLRLQTEKKKAKAAKAALKAQVKAGLLPPSALLTAPIVTKSLLNKRETEFVKELAKRYAPNFQEDYDEPEEEADFKLKKKRSHGHNKKNKHSHHGKGSGNRNGDDEPETSFEDDTDVEDSNTASSMEPISGAFNSFGAGPRKSPLNQAGCSGSHIHLCSGTTVYINSNDDTNTKTVQDTTPDVDDEEEDENPTDDTDLRDAKWQRYWNRQRQQGKGQHKGQGQQDEQERSEKDSKKGGHHKNHKNKSKKHGKKNDKEQESVEEEDH